MIDFHPLMSGLDNNWRFEPTFDSLGGKHVETDGVGDYVGDDWNGNWRNKHKANEFSWGIGDIITALISNGLRLLHFKEYAYINAWQRFPDMVSENGRFYPPSHIPKIPLMFSIVAENSKS
jgi:hypothetical protein